MWPSFPHDGYQEVLIATIACAWCHREVFPASCVIMLIVLDALVNDVNGLYLWNLDFCCFVVVLGT